MSVKLRAASGSYDVRASEMASRHANPAAAAAAAVKTCRCTVHFLDDSHATFDIDKRAKAGILLDKVFDHLELIEKDYFGLQYHDPVGISDGATRWLDPLKTIKKQVRGPPFTMYFRVKFYVSDPSKLSEEYTRYHFFLQVKKDILEGKLIVPYQTAVLLASYAVQSELGDYNPDEHVDGYLADMRFLQSQTPEFEREVSELHRKHRGRHPAECELMFLETVQEIAMYGVDLHKASWVRDECNLDIQLGVTSVGLVVFQNNIKINTFSWSKIVKISFKRKQFFIQLRKESTENIENLIGFNMVSYRSCKNLWKSCVEHHTFFRLHTPPAPKPGLFSLGSKFRYSGRTEFQTIEDSKRKAKIERTFTRSPSKRYARRTVGATTREAILEERMLPEAPYPRPAPPHSTSMDSFTPYTVPRPPLGGGAPAAGIPSSTSFPNNLRSTASPPRTLIPNTQQHQPPSQQPYYVNQPPVSDPAAAGGFHHSTVRATLPNDYKHADYNTAPHKKAANVSGGGGGHYGNGWATVDSSGRRSAALDTSRTDSRFSRSFDSRSDGQGSLPSTLENRSGQRQRALLNRQNRQSPAKTVAVPTHVNGGTNGSSGTKVDDDGGFLDKRRTTPTHKPSPTYLEVDGKMDPASFHDLPAYLDNNMPNGSAVIEGPGLVTIRMKPDSLGRFGFNVKGGADQGMPIIVSRVAPGTPADICIPRLNEGDQVLYINGRDVSTHTHEQVVMYIRASRETHSGGELSLIVRPNVYIGEDTPEEPDFQYIPDTPPAVSGSGGAGGLTLEASMVLLQEGLDSGAALTQFEQLYRKKPGLTMNAARLSENIARNRYRDISPYDQTRVKIKGSGGDYINANFVNMEIPGSGIVNRYIAAQGPLPNTCADFWTMVWEQHCTLVVMLTTNVERGRVKCHQYWPDLYETADFGPLQVTCLKEDASQQSFSFREFTLMGEGHAERHITQMQYSAWPDHGVPDDSADFLSFVDRVRHKRCGMVEPTVVHCSAGIGRTGVLITMETALCLIEAGQPVLPLDITRQMRDQRAMLIQTASQYKFVCEAILRVYNEKMVQPLDDYKR